MSPIFKKVLPHLVVILGFALSAILYFSPVLKGEAIYQSDIVNYIGMAKQQKDFKQVTGKETYWTNSAFGGMPTYQLGAKYPHNYIKSLDLSIRFLPRPADYLFLYFIGFYIFMLSLKVDFKLAAFGALCFGFSTYLIIILGVGHNSKAHAIAYMPLVLAGIIYVFRQKWVLGFLLTTIALGLELVANHFQMTYYLFLLVLVLGLTYLIDAYTKKTVPQFFKSVGVIAIAAILAVGLNATNFMATQEYVKESTRGDKTITIDSNGASKKEGNGLSKNYITEYSYGWLESFNLFIPRFLGGGSYENVGKDSKFYDYNRKQGANAVQAKQIVENTPTYWGDQPIVEAPAYIGAVIIFLFVFGLFIVRGRIKWWLVGGAISSLLLSYGKNFGLLTDFFIDYIPFYNKFRAVSSIQVILELCVPALAVFGLYKVTTTTITNAEKNKALYFSTAITGGLALLFLVFKSSLFDFVGVNDSYYASNYGKAFIEAIRADRQMIFTQDTLRTLVLVLLSAGALWAFFNNKIKETALIITITVLAVFDLVQVDRRYVNTDDFVSARKMEIPFRAHKADRAILQDKSNYRVFDVMSQGSRASYFHNALNGYHAAKLRRYNDLYEFYISKNNINVLNLLNTKYIIAEADNKPYPYPNPDANGNAWFINKLKVLPSANDEILALETLKSEDVAITTFKGLKSASFVKDSLAMVKVSNYAPNKIIYQTSNLNKGFMVCSEMYYGNGWKATVDGKETPIYRVDYALRGVKVPAGNHEVVFEFDPQVVKTGSTIALCFSILVGLLLILGAYLGWKYINNKCDAKN